MNDDETAAFHHNEDMTETVWFLVRFFIITFAAAAAFIGGTILLIRWAIGL